VLAGAETRRKALVTGLTGQDGSFLAELLLERGYAVTGMIRAEPRASLGLAEHLRGRLDLVWGDLLDPNSLELAVREVGPNEIYHLAAPSFVPDSWERPAETIAAIAGGTATLLEAVRDHAPDARVFVAISAAVFGTAPESPQREETPCRPQNPYAAAKLAALNLVEQLRAHDALFACAGIFYNHESERRPDSFVSRKITKAAAAIRLGLADAVALGDLDAVRDWSFAGDVVRGAWLTLQHDRPDDYIFASGIPHTVRELAELAFDRVGLRAEDYIRIDRKLVRGSEELPLVGDATRARTRLGWRPTLSFEELIERMVDADLRESQTRIADRT
jgi:GDPmannose 4,6-dehydratase